MKKIAFLCTANSCRSQMAEGFARKQGAGTVAAWSAGVISAEVSKRASTVMREAGVDISGQWSKTIDEIPLEDMDLVVTLCENARQGVSCRNVPASVRKLHMAVKDPMGAQGSPEEIMDDFRRARDEIKTLVAGIMEDMGKAGAQGY